MRAGQEPHRVGRADQLAHEEQAEGEEDERDGEAERRPQGGLAATDDGGARPRRPGPRASGGQERSAQHRRERVGRVRAVCASSVWPA